jgi:leader peptidase (prepilin peptidase)/N-methyltransferase
MRAKPVGPMAGRPWTYACTAAAAAAIAAAATSLAVAPETQRITGAGLALLMAAIAATDARYFVIPDTLNIAALALALVEVGIHQEIAAEAIGWAIIRGVVLSLLFLGLRLAYRRLRNRDGIGLGDVKLAGAAGAWLSWQAIPIAIEIAALAALGAYTIHRYACGRALRAGSRLPFGLFFAPAIWLTWFLEATQVAPF